MKVREHLTSSPDFQRGLSARTEKRVTEELIDRLYEAALIPEVWTDALEQMNKISGSQSNSLFVFSERFSPRGVSTGSTSDLLETFLSSDAWRNSPSVRWTLNTRPCAFQSVDDFLTDAEIATDEVWLPLAERGFGKRLSTPAANK